jgi:hypothetical protein
MLARVLNTCSLLVMALMLPLLLLLVVNTLVVNGASAPFDGPLVPICIFIYRTSACNQTLPIVLDRVQSIVTDRYYADFTNESFVCLEQTIGGHTGLGIARTQIGLLANYDFETEEQLPGTVQLGPVHSFFRFIDRPQTYEIWFSIEPDIPFGSYVLFDSDSNFRPKIVYQKWPSYCANRAFTVEYLKDDFTYVYFELNLVDVQFELDWPKDVFEGGTSSVTSLTFTMDSNFTSAKFCLGVFGQRDVHCLSPSTTLGYGRSDFSSFIAPEQYLGAMYYQAVFQDQMNETQVRYLFEQTPFGSLQNDAIGFTSTRGSFEVDDSLV